LLGSDATLRPIYSICNANSLCDSSEGDITVVKFVDETSSAAACLVNLSIAGSDCFVCYSMEVCMQAFGEHMKPHDKQCFQHYEIFCRIKYLGDLAPLRHCSAEQWHC
jgi:hypothetical protein